MKNMNFAGNIVLYESRYTLILIKNTKSEKRNSYIKRTFFFIKRKMKKLIVPIKKKKGTVYI